MPQNKTPVGSDVHLVEYKQNLLCSQTERYTGHAACPRLHATMRPPLLTAHAEETHASWILGWNVHF